MNNNKSKTPVAIFAGIILAAVSASGSMRPDAYGNPIVPVSSRNALIASAAEINGASDISPPGSPSWLENVGAIMRFPVSDGYAFEGVDEIYALPYFLALIIVGVVFVFVALMPNPYRMNSTENRTAPANPERPARRFPREPYNRRIIDNNSFTPAIRTAPKTMR